MARYNGYGTLMDGVTLNPYNRPGGDKMILNKDKILKYSITAFPTSPNKTGVRRFKIGEDSKLFIEEFEPGELPALIPYSEQ